MKLRYFAWLRERVGCAEEDVSLPAGVQDVAGLMDWLRSRGPQFAEALAQEGVVRAAVNLTHARPDHPVSDDDEVALFPPVTGG